eukprot:2815579-Prymnesium_polylepis.1
MRRSASPRLRQPQTKGTLSLFLLMWLSSSAIVSTCGATVEGQRSDGSEKRAGGERVGFGGPTAAGGVVARGAARARLRFVD